MAAMLVGISKETQGKSSKHIILIHSGFTPLLPLYPGYPLAPFAPLGPVAPFGPIQLYGHGLATLC